MRDLLEGIAEHGTVDVSPATARRIHARARRVFLREAHLAGRPWLAGFDRLWNRWIEPAAVTAVAVVQLVWVLETVRRLMG